MTSQPLSVYIHWPFCLSKCPYCDFNSHVRAQIDETAWADAFSKEIHRVHSLYPHHTLCSIFFGGGTPSLMPLHLVEHILRSLENAWEFSSDIEITLEANPTSVEQEKFQGLARMGIHRLSLGIQSLEEKALQFLGRDHTVSDAQRALELAFRYFKRVSFDLIYARPEQTEDAWARELQEALTFPTQHLSLYQLTIEPGTQFYTRHQRGDWMVPDDEHAARLYELTDALTQAHGMISYEISNYAFPGEESAHNLCYWTYQPYIGIGPGAHGRPRASTGARLSTQQYRAPETWLKHVLHSKDGGDESVSLLNHADQATEQLMMGLRLLRSFPLNHLPVPWDQVLDHTRIQHLEATGFLKLEQDPLHPTLTLTPRGRLCLNQILSYILL